VKGLISGWRNDPTATCFIEYFVRLHLIELTPEYHANGCNLSFDGFAKVARELATTRSDDSG
jgi:hypothetical protein